MIRRTLISSLAILTTAALAQDAPQRAAESRDAWRYAAAIGIDGPAPAGLCDVVLPPQVFDGARRDLADLRIDDASGREVPYDLRVRITESQRQAIEAEIFNQVDGPDGVRELQLDLGDAPPAHNELELRTPGRGFRRRVVIDGADEPGNWGRLAEGDLLSFAAGDERLVKHSISYPRSRFRYLRVRVQPDPVVDDAPVPIERVNVRYRVEIPGETVVRDATLGPRAPVKTGSGPGSEWIIDLGADRVPVRELRVGVSNEDFVRDYRIEAAPLDEPFRRVGTGVWRRRAGDDDQTLTATFDEVVAAKLKLVVVDNRNPPLRLSNPMYAAPARQVVFESSALAGGPLRLRFGNPAASSPRYDFARNLARPLDPPPTRAVVGDRTQNPNWRPAPQPFTERWPWLPYLALSAAVIVLAVIIARLARGVMAEG